jgi:hypothetical protein
MLKRNAYRTFLALTTLEGVVASFFLLRIPSMDRNVQFLGYSLSRLGVAFVTLVFALFFAFLTARAFFDERWLDRLHHWLQTRLTLGDRLLVVTLTLTALAIGGILLIFIWNLTIVHQYDWYSSVFKSSFHYVYEFLLVIFDRLTPLLVWATLVVIQLQLTLYLVFQGRYKEERFWNWPIVSKTILVLGMVLLSVIHWSVLALGMRLEKLLPGWYWEVYRRSLDARQMVFLAMLGLSLILVTYILRNPRRTVLNLALIVGLGYLLQISFGFAEGQGYEYIRRKYTDSYHRTYANIAAADSIAPLTAVREYEQRYGQKMFPSTKPPGVVFFYILLEDVVNTVSPEQTVEGRFLVLTRFMAVAFPLVAILVVGTIYSFMRQLVEPEQAIAPAILYIFVPNILLIPMFLDQVLYPLLFMLGVLLLWFAMKRRSLLLAFAAGIYIYCAVFFTFAMVPLLPFFALLVGLDYLINYKNHRIAQPLSLFIVMGLGILFTLISFRLFLNYDILLRYETANRVVRNFDFILRTGGTMTEALATTAVRPSVGQIIRAALLNNLEFAAAVGIPVFLLFVWRAIATVVRLVRRQVTELDLALGALLLTFVALNLYGQMQGEAARLWMYWVPMVVIFGGLELTSQFRRKELAFYLVITLQLITIWMTFMYQDFLV